MCLVFSEERHPVKHIYYNIHTEHKKRGMRLCMLPKTFYKIKHIQTYQKRQDETLLDTHID